MLLHLPHLERDDGVPCGSLELCRGCLLLMMLRVALRRIELGGHHCLPCGGLELCRGRALPHRLPRRVGVGERVLEHGVVRMRCSQVGHGRRKVRAQPGDERRRRRVEGGPLASRHSSTTRYPDTCTV